MTLLGRDFKTIRKTYFGGRKKMIKTKQIWDMAQKLGITFDGSYVGIVTSFMELDRRDIEAMEGPSRKLIYHEGDQFSCKLRLQLTA